MSIIPNDKTQFEPIFTNFVHDVATEGTFTKCYSDFIRKIMTFEQCRPVIDTAIKQIGFEGNYVKGYHQISVVSINAFQIVVDFPVYGFRVKIWHVKTAIKANFDVIPVVTEKHVKDKTSYYTCRIVFTDGRLDFDLTRSDKTTAENAARRYIKKENCGDLIKKLVMVYPSGKEVDMVFELS